MTFAGYASASGKWSCSLQSYTEVTASWRQAKLAKKELAEAQQLLRCGNKGTTRAVTCLYNRIGEETVGHYQPLPNVIDLAQLVAQATLQLPEADRPAFLAERRHQHYQEALNCTHDPQAAEIWVEMLHKRIERTIRLLAASDCPGEATPQMDPAFKATKLEVLRKN